MSETEDAAQAEMEGRMIEAFRDAYPEVPPEKADHMARNFTQVVNGIVEIGRRAGGEREPTHMDVANGLVYWSTANTALEGLGTGPSPVGSITVEGERAAELMSEVVSRVADWLIGLRILSGYPELYRLFVKGAIAAGASDWETSRDRLQR